MPEEREEIRSAIETIADRLTLFSNEFIELLKDADEKSERHFGHELRIFECGSCEPPKGNVAQILYNIDILRSQIRSLGYFVEEV